MGFDDFKIIEKCIVKFEERLLTDLRAEQRENRREVLRTKSTKAQTQTPYWKLLESQAKEENILLKKISKSVVAHYGVSASVYQGWIETYLEKAENQEKLMNFRQELRKTCMKAASGPVKEFTKEDCLKYSEKLQGKIEGPKAQLLIKQARNTSNRKVPIGVFAHRAQQELQLYNLQAQDELFLEMEVEHEEYLRKMEDYKVDETEEFRAIHIASKDRMRAIILKENQEKEGEAAK